MWVCWGVLGSKWHGYHQMVSSRRCVDARVPAKFLVTIWTHQQGVKGVRDRTTTCFNVAAFAKKKMQQCYDRSAVLWYKDWCQLGQNKLEYHQISRGDVWPHSAQRGGRERGRSTAAQVSAQFQSNSLFLCVRCWNKNKLVTIHQLHTRLLGKLQRSKTRMNVWSWGLQPYNSVILCCGVEKRNELFHLQVFPLEIFTFVLCADRLWLLESLVRGPILTSYTVHFRPQTGADSKHQLLV